jgi:hypothetical protein
MHYRILTRLSSNRRYRGVARYSPPYREDLPTASPANVAWDELVHNNERVDSIERATTLGAMLGADGCSVDVVAVFRCEELLMAKAQFPVLGYDVVWDETQSALSWGVAWEPARKLLGANGTILDLLESHFSPRLNVWGLFSDQEVADLFCRVMRATQDLAPGFWEAPGHFDPQVFGVAGVLVRADNE